jgi:hypothetical protein
MQRHARNHSSLTFGTLRDRQENYPDPADSICYQNRLRTASHTTFDRGGGSFIRSDQEEVGEQAHMLAVAERINMLGGDTTFPSSSRAR